MSGLLDAAAEALGRAAHEIEDWATEVAQELESKYGSEISNLKDALKLEYGCWCGPGNRCTDDVDATDGCCHQHDLKYDALGLAYDSMWTAQAFVATMSADQWLVDCVSSAEEPDTEVGRIYRSGLVEAFKARIMIAGWLKEL